jgi:ferredoxin-NADP reductase/DMSO/TMAO reductase YedYZ heme-binding membrane subunit
MRIDRFTKWVVIVNCAVPVTLLGWDALNSRLGANPVNFAIRTTGILSLIFLVLSLTVTPLARLAHWSSLGQLRRVMGLYAFFHALVHFGLFYLFDRNGNLGDVLSEIALRRYLLVGIVGLLVMVPLAVTSTNRMIQRLGPKRWKVLHRLAYVAAAAGALHYYMLVKADTTQPIIFAALLGVLFAYRLGAHYVQLRGDLYRLRHPPPQPVARSGDRATARSGERWEGVLRLAKVFVETPEVRTFRLVAPSGTTLPFQYLPGQFLTLRVNIDGQDVRRSYTIASPPTRSAYCELTIKREEQGYASRHLHDVVREGALFNVSAPAGRFTFTGAEADKIVMIAGGVGVTPLMAKIRYLTDIAWPGKIHLVYSVKTERDVIFRSELEELQRRFPNLKVDVTLTQEASVEWTGKRGRLSAAMLMSMVPDIGQSRVHFCGPTEMVEPLKKALRELGVADEQMKSEAFGSPSRKRLLTSYPAPAGRGLRGEASTALTPEGIENANGTASTASIRFARSNKSLAGAGTRTVLELAESLGIALPYDCRSGVCGQCKTRLLSGSVVMAAEDALDPLDRANGVILACQASCRDDVVVDA